MTGSEFAEKYSSQDYREMAYEIAKKLTIRTYDECGSKDFTRDTTSIEEEIIAKIAIGAMDSYGFHTNANAQTICGQAEFTLMQFMPEVNTYDTIYIPLMKCFEIW